MRIPASVIRDIESAGAGMYSATKGELWVLVMTLRVRHGHSDPPRDSLGRIRTSEEAADVAEDTTHVTGSTTAPTAAWPKLNEIIPPSEKVYPTPSPASQEIEDPYAARYPTTALVVYCRLCWAAAGPLSAA